MGEDPACICKFVFSAETHASGLLQSKLVGRTRQHVLHNRRPLQTPRRPAQLTQSWAKSPAVPAHIMGAAICTQALLCSRPCITGRPQEHSAAE